MGAENIMPLPFIEHKDDTDFKDGDDGGIDVELIQIQPVDNGYILTVMYDEAPLIEIFADKHVLFERIKELL